MTIRKPDLSPSAPNDTQWFELTDNERAWMEFLRLINLDGLPSPTLALVQAVRVAFWADERRR